jgi:SAM-dependent methyltransferase
MGFSGPADAKFLIFFCVMISRQCINTVGSLCEDFQEGGGEDTSYCLEAIKKGFEMHQVPPETTWAHKDYMVGNFPIYHAGEKTVHGLSNWNEIFERNSNILAERYNRRLKLSNNAERIVYGKEHNIDIHGRTRYEWARKNIYGSKILEIGCASGYSLRFLKDIPNLDYTGIDYDQPIIDYAKEQFGDIPGVKFQQADINNFNFEQYDSIIAFEVLEHIDIGVELAQKLKQHCKRLLVSLPYKEAPGTGSPHHKLKNLSELDFPGFEYYYILSDGSFSNKYIRQGDLTLLTMKWSSPELIKIRPTVTCVISTKNRSHTTLPMTIMGICNQTVKPNHLIIYDDGDFKPELNKDPIYSKLFAIISASGISWEYKYGKKIGQVSNHIQSLKDAKTDFIYRLDDDNVPEYNVLEYLLDCVKDDVGAVGGLVINSFTDVPATASNKIEDIFLGINEAWFFHPKDSQPKEVDHLYSSFIYRRDIAEYPDNLSCAGHREETILTYGMKRKGYKIILNPSVKTWHFNNPEGGIRTNQNQSNFEKDSYIFSQKLNEWKVKPNEYQFVVLENGLGDHFAFKSVLPQYFEKYKDKTHIFFVTFPAVFEDVPNIKLASIADAKNMFGEIDRYNIYKLIADERFDKSLPSAYKTMYGLKGEVVKGRFGMNDVVEGIGKNIIISPYSFTPQHAKSYPYWKELIPLIKSLGFSLTQIGRNSEEKLDNMDEYCFDLSFKELEEKVYTCKTWIGVDNFFQHFINSLNNPVKGIVIFGTSDPKLFGYHYNTNILKSKKYLRSNQIETWNGVIQDLNAFERPEIIFDIVKKLTL